MKNIGCCCQASEIAKLVINKCVDKQISLTNIKLQKLLIVMQGVMFASYHRPLFKEAMINASYGLGVKEVHEDFFQDIKFKDKYMSYVVPLDIEKEVIDKVLRQYGQKDSFELNKLPEMKKLHKVLENYKFNISNTAVKYIFESTFKDNIVVWGINLDNNTRNITTR